MNQVGQPHQSKKRKGPSSIQFIEEGPEESLRPVQPVGPEGLFYPY
jgi:hypothetical protein